MKTPTGASHILAGRDSATLARAYHPKSLQLYYKFTIFYYPLNLPSSAMQKRQNLIDKSKKKINDNEIQHQKEPTIPSIQFFWNPDNNSNIFNL